MKTRADLLLVAQGLAATRSEAQALIMAGVVFVDEKRVEKSGDNLPSGVSLTVKEKLPFVSRGGLKLQGALEHFKVPVLGKTCLDVGASTGGFTDCLLQRGAAKVYAIDVGHGQLHPKLRNDARVVCLEETNFRHFDAREIPEPVTLAVADVSFISLSLILPNIVKVLAPESDILCLVKPQFELSPKEVKKGVVTSEDLRRKAVKKIEDVALSLKLEVLGGLDSPIKGPKGNHEYLLYLRKPKNCDTNA